MGSKTYLRLAGIFATLSAASLMAALNDNAALWRPRFATPAIVALDSVSNRQFTAEVRGSAAAAGWSAALFNDLKSWPCQIVSSNYGAANINRGTEPGWKVIIRVAADTSPELFSLSISNNETLSVQGQAVQVIKSFATNFYILHMADEQIVQEFHNVPSGMWYTTVGTAEEFAWEQQTINLINPRFVFITGDQVDYNGALDGYNNWSNWGYSPSGARDFTVQETMTIEQRLVDLYKNYHLGFRVPYVSCPGNHDVPPTGWQLHGSSPTVYWHAYGVTNYESNFGQRSWSFRMGDFYVLMHDWSDSSLKTWANNDFTNALNDPSVNYRLIGQHYVTDQGIKPSGVSLMLVGHTHTTDTYQSAPYYIYVDGPAFSYGTCGFFNFRQSASGWTCDQTSAPRNTATDVWRLFGDNGSLRMVRSDQADAMNVTTTSITITNDLPQNFYDGRVRFLLKKGTYSSVTNGSILAQYDVANGTKTAVLVKVNIPASGTVKVSIADPPPALNSEVEDPSHFGSRMKIAIAGYDRSETLQSFPVLVSLSTNIPGFSYHQFASPTGGDLRFTDSGGTAALFHEIDEWNTNGVSSVWVQMRSLATSNDFIWAYWGNPSLVTTPSWATNGSVWSDGFDLVWHLKENGFPYADASLNYPALSGVAPSTSAGQIGRACLFNGSSQFLNGGLVNAGSAFTLSAWVKLDATATNIQTVWANKPGGWNSAGFGLYVNSYNTSDGKVLLETGNGTSGLTASTVANVVTSGQWHFLVAAVDETGGQARLYVDGMDRTQSAAISTAFPNQAGINLGRLTNGALYLKGAIDEARIEPGVRSSNWVWAAYLTARINSAFVNYAPVAQKQPALSVVDSGHGMVLKWPGSGVGFSVYSATNLTPPIQWLPVPSVISLINTQWEATLPSNNLNAGYYRLQSQ